MLKKSRKYLTADGLREVKTAGYTATRKVKRDKTVNRRAGLHDKLKNLQGEARVKRRKPLALKHVRRMRKIAAAVCSIGVVGAVSVFGVGFLMPSKNIQLDGEFETVCFEVPANGAKPTDYTLVENVGFLNYVLQHQPYWSSVGNSTTVANAGIVSTQTVDTYKMYYNGVLVSTDIALNSTLASLNYGEQFCQANDVVLTRKATSKDEAELKKGVDAPWSTDPAIGWTLKGFRRNRGLPPYDFSVYVLNEKTIANAQDYSVVENADGTYSMTLTLNVNTGVDETSADYYYRLQMKANGGLYDLPIIYTTTVTYTFDGNWRVLTCETSDTNKTTPSLGLTANCTSNAKTTFYYDEELAKNTFWEDYFKGEYERQKDALKDDEVIPDGSTDTAFGYVSGAFASVMSEGAVFKIDLNIDELDLSGVVSVEMNDGGLGGLTAKLGDILVWLDGDTLYINDGASKYKTDISGLLSSPKSEEDGVSAQGLTDGLNVNDLMEQMTGGEFVLNEETGIATLNSAVELFGLKIPMEFEFQKTDSGIELNFLKAQIALGEKTVNAELRFGTEDDKPAIPADTSVYADIMNDGVTLDVSLALGGVQLDGVAKIIMNEGKFTGVYAKLADIEIYYVDDTLYLSVGDFKYKLDTAKLGTGNGADLAAVLGNLDIKTLLNDVLKNLTTDENSLGSSLNITIAEIEKTLTAALDIQLKGGIKVDADLTLDDLNVKVSATLTNEEVTLPELTGYQDILNDGVTLNVSLGVDGFTLDGVAKIIMSEGKFAGVYADLGTLGVYYDNASGKLYLKIGAEKYFLDTTKFGTGSGIDLAATFGNLDTKTLINDILKNLTTDENSLGSSLEINIDALEKVLTAALDIRLKGGINIDADLTLDGLNVKLSAALSNQDVILPVLSEYKDVLNSDITLDVKLTLLTGLVDEQTGKRDEVTLDGKVALCLKDGKFTEIRADFGGLAIYFDFNSKQLYIKLGTTKIMLDIANMGSADTNILSSLNSGELITADLPTAINQLITNLVGDSKIISTGADITLLGALTPVWAELNLSENLSVRAGLSLLGIDAEAQVKFSDTALEGLSEEEKKEYTDVLKDAWTLVDGLLGEHISASVNGTVYSYTDEYADQNNIKYNFNATLDYDKGHTVNEEGETVPNKFPIHVDKGTLNEDGNRTDMNFYIDSTLYLHFGLALEATKPGEDSLYLDLWLLDGNPVTNSTGITTADALTKDDELDVYIKISKYKEAGKAYPVYDKNGVQIFDTNGNPVTATREPLCLYAPVSEIMTLVSMAGSAADLHGLTFENSEELTKLVADIADIVDRLLIDNYLKYTHDQFASLGNSLIPQILGTSLNDLLNKLLGSAETVVEDASSFKLDLSKKYVNGITYGDNKLEIKLNSAELFGEGATDDLLITLEKTPIDGEDYLSSIGLNNLYTGENNSQKLDLGLNLSYGEIARPADMSGFRNVDGLDTLLKSLVNSATHKVDGTEDKYDLNHYYLLQGNVTANINVIGIKVGAKIQIKSVAVYIDGETNDVSIDAHIYYDGVQELNQVAIDGDADVYLSICGNSIIIKKIQYSHYVKSGLVTNEVQYSPAKEEVRSMTLQEFADNLMDNLTFLFSFGSVITSNIENSSGGEGVSFDGFDYGKYLNTILSYYVSEENGTGASWTVAINGNMLTSLVGMTMSDIPVKFSAVLNDDGTYTVKTLEILQSKMELLGNAVKLEYSGSFTYCNPHEEMGEGYADSSDDLFNMDVKVNSDYDLQYIDSSFTAACGAFVKLPVGVVNTQGFMLDGYTATTVIGGTQNVQFESFVEENGIRYGLTKLISDTVYTAVWNKVYSVSFTGTDGKELYSIYYHENEVLSSDNMPACPEIYGYTGEWEGANGTVVTENLSFTLKYSPIIYTVNFIDGDATTAIERAYGSTIGLSDLETNTHLAQYIYDESGNRFDAVTVSGDATYNVYRTGKTFTVAYESDVTFDGSALDTSMQFGDDTDYLAAVTNPDYSFLGWFVKVGEKYNFVADANALKTLLSENNFADGSTVTLNAVWVNGVTATVTGKNDGQYDMSGSYAVNYSSDVSKSIAENSNISYSTQIVFWLSFKNAGNLDDKLNTKTVTGTDFSFSNENSFNAIFQSKVSVVAQVTVSFVCDGKTIYTFDTVNSNFYKVKG